MSIHRRSRLRSIFHLAPLALAVSGLASTAVAEPSESAGANASPGVAALGTDDTLLAGIPGEGEVSLADAKKWLADPAHHVELSVNLPKGINAAKGNLSIPADNPSDPSQD